MNGTQKPFQWPRLRDLPEEDREPFWQWLAGQTRPWLDGVAMSEQDAYYRRDYARWVKYGRPTK